MKHKIHFGVRSSDKRASDVWSCWTQPNRGDAYLTSDAVGKVLKLSNHCSGQTHLAYHNEKRDELFTPETLPTSRFILKGNREAKSGEIAQPVASIFFPSKTLSDTTPVPHQNTVWIPEASEGNAVEVGVFRTSIPLPNSWPGKNEGACLVGELPLGQSQRIFIVWRFAPFTMPIAPENFGNPKLFNGRTEDDLLTANRMVIFGMNDVGFISLIETSVKIGRNLTHK